MKNVFYIALSMLVLVSCQNSDKIGFIDNSKVLKDLETRFEKLENDFRKKYDSIDQAFQMEVQEFQIGASKMSQNGAQKLYQELGQKKQFIDQQKQYEAQQFQQEYQSQLDSIITKVKKFENDYGKSNGYKYILGTSDAMSSVLYGEEKSDLTKTILEALNANYKKK